MKSQKFDWFLSKFLELPGQASFGIAHATSAPNKFLCSAVNSSENFDFIPFLNPKFDFLEL